jgi:hypothetical protein
MKTYIVLVAILLSGCAGKTRLVPKAYMPTPPKILMQPAKELNTIKKEK